MRRVGMQWISISLLLYCLVQYCVSGRFVHANTDGTVFLERGHRAIVPCPHVKSHQIPSGDVDAMYWYYRTISRTSLLISYFNGRVAPQNGIPEGVYDIDNEFNLVIESVTASNEGTYYYEVKPRLKMIEEGQVEVLVGESHIDENVFLERGHRGIVPCPPVKSRRIPPGDVEATNWYYDSISETAMLIRYVVGRVEPQNGIRKGVYDIDDEFNLVIENVTASNEGTYYVDVISRLKVKEKGQVGVFEKVSPSHPYPTVIGCNQDHDADTCKVRVRHDSTVHNLTCVMEQVKPAVQLRWIRLFLGGLTKLNASTTVWPVVLPAYTGSSLTNNTYSTSASVQVAAVDDEEVYECEAMGVAVGKGARMIVRFTKTQPTTANYDEVRFSSNPGKTLVLTDETSPATNKPVETLGIWKVVQVVMFSIFAIFIFILGVRNIYLDKKLNKFRHMSMMMLDTADIDPTSSSAEEEESEIHHTSKMHHALHTGGSYSSSEEDETNEFHRAPISYVSMQTASIDDC